MSATVAASFAEPARTSSAQTACEVTDRASRFHTRALELLQSKHNDPKYSKLNVIQKLDCILIDLAKIALELYYAHKHNLDKLIADMEFRRVMSAITETDFISYGQCHLIPNAIMTQKAWFDDYLNDSLSPNQCSFRYIDVEVTTEQISEAFEFYNKVISLIHQTL